MSYWSFLARFVGWATAAFTLWTFILADWYVTFILALGPYVSALAGFGTDIDGSGRAARVFFLQGNTRLPQGTPYGVHLETAALGLLPFLALVAATTTRSVLQRLSAAGAGIAIFAVFHLSLFAAYPFFLSRSGYIVDSLGAFWAILGYCGFPFLLWLVLVARGRGSEVGGRGPL